MKILDINARIKEFMEARGLNEYQLAKKSNLSQSTIKNIFRRNTVPNFTTLEAICSAFGITLAQFFAEDDLVELSPEQQDLFKSWVALTDEQKELLFDLIKNMR